MFDEQSSSTSPTSRGDDVDTEREPTWECPWCHEEVTDGEKERVTGSVSACKQCMGFAPEDDWEVSDSQSESDSRNDSVQQSRERTDNAYSGTYDDASPVPVTVETDPDDVDFQNEEMTEYYGRTRHYTDDDGEDHSGGEETSSARRRSGASSDDAHKLDDKIAMECACGANAVHRGDEIVCTDSGKVIWQSGERDAENIDARSDEELDAEAEKLKEMVDQADDE
jgi:hypothetical protein